MYWVDEIVEKILKKYPDKEKYVCASGITPSGDVHIGNLRDVLTSAYVVRGLQEKGKNAELLWSWDDYDRFRKVPKNVPQEFEKYLGLPLVKVPDPASKTDSYARHFEKKLDETLPILGIKARILRQSEMYQKNSYFELVKVALQKRKQIAEILYSYKAQEAGEEDIENYYPLNVYCQKCGNDFAKIISYDGENMVLYRCKCEHEATVDITKNNIGKLAWRVDWPMRWKYENVTFEPAGRDHSSAGGSFEVSSKIAREIFGIEPPIYQGYEFVGLSGSASKMSSSTGDLFTPEMLLEVYEPEIIRWFYTRVKPLQKINFALDDQILKNYSEWDEFLRKSQEKKLDEVEQRILDFTKIDSESDPIPGTVSFRQLAAFAQIAKGNLEELKKMFKGSGNQISEKDIKDRLPRAMNWTDKYAPDQYRIKLREKPNKEFFAHLDDKEQEMVKELIRGLDSNWNLESLTNLLYEIPKKVSAENEIKQNQKNYFRILYQLICGSDTGPRLPTFFMALGQEKIKGLLTF